MASSFNLIFAFVTFLTLFWGIFAGALVDRFPRKRLFLLTNLVEGIFLLSIALIGWNSGSLTIPLIVAVFGLTAFGYRLHYPNLYAFVQEMTPPENYSKVTSYIEIVGQATNVVAGSFAVLLLEGWDFQGNLGVLGTINFSIDAWPIHKIFTLDAITYFISMTVIFFIQYEPDKKFVVETGQLISRLRTGFQFLNKNRIILLFGFFSHSIFVIFLVTLFAVIPLYITNHLHEDGRIFGIMEVLYGVGALSAGFFIRKLTKNLKTVASIVRLIFVTTLLLFLCAFTKSTLIFLLAGIIIGFTNAGTRVLRVSYLFRVIPNEVVGRVNSIFSLLNIVVRGLFVLFFSLTYFGQNNHIIYAYMILGIFTTMAGIVLWLNAKKIAKRVETEQ